MPRSVYLVYRNKIDDSKLAKETLLKEQSDKEEKFGRDFASLVEKMKNAENATEEEKQKNTFVNAEYYKSSAIERIEDYMHELSLDYRLGLIPKEYFLERLYQLKNLKGDFNYKPQLPSLFIDSAEGNFEENKVVYTRMMGGYRKHWNTFTPEMFELMPESSKAAYENEELALKAYEQEKNKKVEVENEEDREDLDDFDLSLDNIPADEDEDLVATYAGPLDYVRAFDIEYRKVTKEEAEQLNEDADIYVTTAKINEDLIKFKNLFKNSFKNEEEEKAFNDVLKNYDISDRLNQRYSMYIVWAMGQEGMSYEQALDSLNGNGPGEEVFARYKKFYIDNQIFNKLEDPAGLKKAVENHVKMLQNAMNKLKEFKFPDIDYMDMKAKGDKSMLHYYRQFYAIANIGVNINQDYIQPILALSDGKETGISTIAMNAVGGIDKYNELMSFWRKIQYAGLHFNNAYGDVNHIDEITDVDGRLYRFNIKNYIGRKKASDFFFRRNMQKIKGKTLGKVIEENINDLRIDSSAVTSMVTYDGLQDNLSFGTIIDYGTGENPRPFMDAMSSPYPQYYKDKQKEIGELFTSHYNSFINSPPKNKKETIEKVVFSPSSPEEALLFLNSKDSDNKTYKNHLMDFFHDFTQEEVMILNMDMAKIKLSDIFLIDGKTVNELYGEKYKNIQNADDREWLYRLEIYKALILQSRDIQVKRYEMGEDGIIRENGSFALLPNKLKHEAVVNNYTIYRAQTKELKEYLERYSRVLDAHKENGKEYKALMDSLKSTIRNLDNDNYEMEKLSGDIDKLKKAVRVFGATAEEADNPVHSANKITAMKITGAYLDESQEMINDLVAGMKGNILAGGNTKSVTDHPTNKKMDEVVTYYNNFTTAYHKSNIIKTEDAPARLEEKKQALRGKKNYQAVKNKFKAKQNLTQEEVAVLNQRISLYDTTKQLDTLERKVSDMFTKPENDPKVIARKNILEHVPINITRGNSIGSIFIAWNMGYNNMSYEQAVMLLKSDKVGESIDAFFEFCENNTLKANPDPKKAKESAVRWADIMNNATRRMKEYKFPDIDYNDSEAVKPYIDELVIMKNLSIDFIQELVQRVGGAVINPGTGSDNIEYGTGKSKEYIDEHFGNSTTLSEIDTFWKKLQTPTFLFWNAINGNNDRVFLTKWNQGGNSYQRKVMLQNLPTNVYGRNYMNKLKGKGIDEITPYEFVEGIAIKKDVSESVARYTDNESEKLTGNTIDYMDGTNRKNAEEYVVNEMSPFVEESLKHKFMASSIDIFVKGIGNFTQEDATALLNTGDDVESMLSYVGAVSKDAHSHLMRIEFAFRDFFSHENYTVTKALGINVFDFFKIEGKTPKELWGDKYKKLSDIEKERCYKAEIIKAVLKGDSEITVQSVLIKDGSFKLGKAYTAFPKKAELQKLKDAVTFMPTMANKMRDKLQDFYNILKETQRDKKANFMNDAKEGSEPYQKMCRTLASALAVLQNPDHLSYSMDRIYRRLKEFHEAAEFYFKRGKTSNPRRLEVAQDAADNIRAYVDMLEDMVKKSDLDIFVRNGENKYVKSWFGDVKRSTKEYDHMYQSFAPLQSINPDELQQKLDDALNIKKAQYEYKMHVGAAMGGIPDASKKLSTTDAAKLFVLNQNMDIVKADLMTVDTINARKDAFDVENLNRSINELKNNRVFELVVKKYPHKAPEKWDEALKKGANIVAKSTEFLSSLENAQRQTSDYVLDETVRLSAKKNLKHKDKYDRLGEVIANQIIIDPRNKSVPQALGAGLVDYKDIVKACTDSLRKDNVLDGGRNAIPDEELQTRISNGTLKADVLAKISSQFSKQMKQGVNKQVTETQNIQRHL